MSDLSSSSTSSYSTRISDRFDQVLERTSSSTSEDFEHANLFHRFDSIKPLIDKLYCEITHDHVNGGGGKASTKCLHRNTFIVKNEGRGRRRFKLSALFTIKLSNRRYNIISIILNTLSPTLII